MIKNLAYSIIHHRDSEVIDYIRKRKQINKNFKVIDIGSSMNSWCISELDATVDILDFNSDKIHFKGNINYFEVWQQILDYVNKNGKFDFSICTHTLEDISNPGLVSSMISKISKSGFVAFPSKYSECNRYTSSFRGWIHHRWIFNHEGDRIVAYPKLCFIEYAEYLNTIPYNSPNKDELSFFWEDSCDIEVINNDYFPSGEYMIEIYKKLLD